MPRNYTPKLGGKRHKKHDSALMGRAAKAVKDGMSYRDAKKKFKNKLKDQTSGHVKGKRKLFLGQVT